jgi:endo-1,4-beta-xylanase
VLTAVNHLSASLTFDEQHFKMVSFTSIVTAAIAATGAIAAPATDLAARSPGALVARQSTPSSAGTHNGCYYSWWTDGGASKAQYTNGNAGFVSPNDSHY